MAHVFIEQYKFNLEIAFDCEQMQQISKTPSEIFREYSQNGVIRTLSSMYYDQLIGHAQRLIC